MFPVLTSTGSRVETFPNDLERCRIKLVNITECTLPTEMRRRGEVA